jgi:argininosuccinate synthase
MAKQVYQGYGYDLASRIARSAIDGFAELVTGTIAVSLYKGNVFFASASDVPHSLYSEANASMEAIGEFDHADSEGFLRVLSVSARALAATGQIKRTS